MNGGASILMLSPSQDITCSNSLLSIFVDWNMHSTLCWAGGILPRKLVTGEGTAQSDNRWQSRDQA